LTRGDNPDHDRIKSLNKKSIGRIEKLEKLSGSGERKALRGGHLKRQAVASEGEERATALEKSAAAYLSSFETDPAAYALFNHVQLEVIRHWSRDQPMDQVPRDKIVAAGKKSEGISSSERNYWDAVALPDGQLTLAVMDGDVHQKIDSLVDAYRAVFDGRSTARERASTVDHLLNLADLHPDRTQADALRALYQRLMSSERSGSTASRSTVTEADPGEATAR
jgi:hypothetical protein